MIFRIEWKSGKRFLTDIERWDFGLLSGRSFGVYSLEPAFTRQLKPSASEGVDFAKSADKTEYDYDSRWSRRRSSILHRFKSHHTHALRV